MGKYYFSSEVQRDATHSPSSARSAAAHICLCLIKRRRLDTRGNYNTKRSEESLEGWASQFGDRTLTSACV